MDKKQNLPVSPEEKKEIVKKEIPRRTPVRPAAKTVAEQGPVASRGARTTKAEEKMGTPPSVEKTTTSTAEIAPRPIRRTPPRRPVIPAIEDKVEKNSEPSELGPLFEQEEVEAASKAKKSARTSSEDKKEKENTGSIISKAEENTKKPEKAKSDKKAPQKKNRIQIDPESNRRKKEESARRRRRLVRQLIGLALTVLIVVGAVTVVRSGITLVQGIISNEDEKDIYQKRVEAFVWFDVLPFETVESLDPNTILEIAMWDILLDKKEEIAHQEDGSAVLPILEIENWGRDLFGPNFRFGKYQTFTSATGMTQGIEYTYDEERSAYIVPATSNTYPYLPTVHSITDESGGVRRVTVGYVATTSDGNLLATPDYEHPVRYMDYMFRRDGSEYYLYKLEPNTTVEVATPASSASSSISIASQPEMSSSVVTDSSVLQEEITDESDTAEEESSSSASEAA